MLSSGISSTLPKSPFLKKRQRIRPPRASLREPVGTSSSRERLTSPSLDQPPSAKQSGHDEETQKIEKLLDQHRPPQVVLLQDELEAVKRHLKIVQLAIAQQIKDSTQDVATAQRAAQVAEGKACRLQIENASLTEDAERYRTRGKAVYDLFCKELESTHAAKPQVLKEIKDTMFDTFGRHF